MKIRQRHAVVVDLGFGDAGKGATVDRLCRAMGATTVVRFNGGAQAAHNVVADDGRHHTFAQFGSGALVPGVRTHLSRFVLVDPLALSAEAAHLTAIGVDDPLGGLTVDRRALLATPYHAAANRLREQARGAARHGSCGMGVGETAAYALANPESAPAVGDCAAPLRLTARLAVLRERLADELQLPVERLGPPIEDCVRAYRAFAGTVRMTDERHLPQVLARERVVLEGAQGVLLDEWYGFHPYTTWSTTTFANATTLLAEAGAAGAGDVLRLGVVRTSTTRHGPGPLVTEDPALDPHLPEPHNATGPWQGAFRRGHFDAVAHRYALTVAGGADVLVVTHLDAAARARGLRLCDAYRVEGGEIRDLTPAPPGDLARRRALTERLLRTRPARLERPSRWAEGISDALGLPVLLTSHGPRTSDATFARTRDTPHRTLTPAG
ncbi:adenylosuccinate synthetase [Streptacidiphilus jiangxiensis]|uniref:Adenylosuccinate synthetase n=1 Tax=Streptacidiphilus jiangxiensis TaxID=235985 RepID=A0A1H7UG58_STRJI|nr:adenylosuccinate synthetase [Streptacidiphilus jiangxiensis]SEL95227.1 adenylosuccinate synthase [Streptacidiphilus jiangxiensis]